MKQLFLLAVLWACAARAADLTVFAAASLREAFGELSRRFEQQHPGVRVELELAGSQELRVQIENGARADVFASADLRHMRALRAEKLVDAPVIFARNEPVLVAPQDGAPFLRTFADLPRAGRVVLGDESVPIGAYSGQILAKAGMRLGDRVVSRELNVRQVLAKVALGEADAGIVYRSDVPAAQGKVRVIPIPPALNVVAQYPVATVAGAPPLAQQFVALLLSRAGQEALARAGFLPP